MDKELINLLDKLGLLQPKKQGLLIIILSVLLFICMLLLNGDYRWTYEPIEPCLEGIGRCHGIMGWGLNMAEWGVICAIGIAFGLVRIYIINSK